MKVLIFWKPVVINSTDFSMSLLKHFHQLLLLCHHHHGLSTLAKFKAVVYRRPTSVNTPSSVTTVWRKHQLLSQKWVTLPSFFELPGPRTASSSVRGRSCRVFHRVIWSGQRWRCSLVTGAVLQGHISQSYHPHVEQVWVQVVVPHPVLSLSRMTWSTLPGLYLDLLYPGCSWHYFFTKDFVAVVWFNGCCVTYLSFKNSLSIYCCLLISVLRLCKCKREQLLGACMCSFALGCRPFISFKLVHSECAEHIRL